MRLVMYVAIFLAATVSSAFGQDSIAVMDLKPIGVSQTLAEAVSENLRTMLIVSGAYRVIERQQLEKILGEYKLSQAGVTENNAAVQLGGLAEANLVLVGSLARMFDSYGINARLIDVKSGECLLARQVEVGSEAQFPVKIDELALSLCNRTPATPPAGAPPDIVGVYRVKGADYVGKLRISKRNELYRVAWNIDNSATGEAPQSFSGVGILHNNMLAVNYGELDDKANVGVAIYDVQLNGERLRGLYSSVDNSNKTGMPHFENGEKIEGESH
jgi:TolB-like protein